MTPKLSIVLDSLRKPLLAWCNKHGVTQSNAVRQALATMLKVEVPEVKEGRRAVTYARKKISVKKRKQPNKFAERKGEPK
jgi:hypothetical protein